MLYSSALEKKDYDFLNNCKFFIDHDYDNTSYNDRYIKTLNCYSIENYLVCEDVISNCLSMDCQLDSSLSNIKKDFLLKFKRDMKLFCDLSREICKVLFISYRLKKQIKFPKKITDFINIECGNITKKDSYSEFISKRFDTSIESLEEEFENLSDHRAIRGKYMLQFMQHWLESVKHKIEKEHEIVSKKDFFNTEMRRFAAASKTPHELKNCLAS